MFTFFKPTSKKSGYLPTSTTDDDEGFLSYRDSSSSTSSSSSPFTKKSELDLNSTDTLLTKKPSLVRRLAPSTRPGTILLALNLLLFITSVLLSLGAYRYVEGVKQNKGNALLKAMSYHVPLLDRIEIPLVEVQVNGTLLNESGSIYRQPPSPEVDAAWERLSNVVPTAVTEEDVLALGKDPSTTARFTPNFGLGSNAFAIELDIFHQLHCLDTLRRNLIHTFEHYHHLSPHYAPSTNASSILTKEIPRVIIEHNMHCVHILQQALTCNPSLEPVTLGWLRTQMHPFPDFSVKRKCVDFQRVVDWQEKNMVDPEMWDALRVPEGAPMGEINPELVKLSSEREIERQERKERIKQAGGKVVEEEAEGGHGGHEGHEWH